MAAIGRRVEQRRIVFFVDVGALEEHTTSALTNRGVSSGPRNSVRRLNKGQKIVEKYKRQRRESIPSPTFFVSGERVRGDLVDLRKVGLLTISEVIGEKRTGPALNPLKGSSARLPHGL